MAQDWLIRTPGHTVCGPEEFGYRTDLPVFDAESTRALTIDQDTTVELRVDSVHTQFVLRRAEPDAEREWVETVGLLPGTAGGLPVLRTLPRPAEFLSDLEVGCTVTEHSPRGLRKSLGQVRHALETAPVAVCVQDTEEPTAVTAMSAHPDPATGAVLWWTWRVLPERGQIVRTRGRIRVLPLHSPVAA